MTSVASAVRLGPVTREITQCATPVLESAVVVQNDEVSAEQFRLRLVAPQIAAKAAPGQFVMLSLVRDQENLPVLPRPMALYDWDVETGTIDIVYRIVGRGTAIMSRFQAGESMVSVGPLGRAFTLLPSTRHLLLVGRGIGVCSLTALGKSAARRGVSLEAVVSARTTSALIGVELFRSFGARVWPVTDSDGSSDMMRIRRLLAERFEAAPVQQVAVCGSERLLALAAEFGQRNRARVEVSLEAHMACGIGYCHGCASGHKGLADESPLICRDGPVFVCEQDAAAT